MLLTPQTSFFQAWRPQSRNAEGQVQTQWKNLLILTGSQFRAVAKGGSQAGFNSCHQFANRGHVNAMFPAGTNDWATDGVQLRKTPSGYVLLHGTSHRGRQ